MKFRIASIAMAAVTAICAAQATALSASAASGCTYSGTPQEVCENSTNMMNYISYWRYSGTYKENNLWTWYNTTECGVVLGKGFKSNISGNYEGQVLHSDVALARILASAYFNTTTFLELYPNARYFTPQLGDQYKLKGANGAVKTVFVYQVPSASNNYRLKTVEVIDGYIKYNKSYYVSSNYLYNANETWQIDYMVRPIKQGDANGDGYVYAVDYADFKSDCDTINNISFAGLSTNGKKALIAAASMDNNKTIDVADWRIVFYNQLQYNSFLNDGRMHGTGYSYVKTLPSLPAGV